MLKKRWLRKFVYSWPFRAFRYVGSNLSWMKEMGCLSRLLRRVQRPLISSESIAYVSVTHKPYSMRWEAHTPGGTFIQAGDTWGSDGNVTQQILGVSVCPCALPHSMCLPPLPKEPGQVHPHHGSAIVVDDVKELVREWVDPWVYQKLGNVSC